MKTEAKAGATAPTPERGWARVMSLGLATPLMLVLMIHPALMLGRDGHYSHGLLSLVMLGVCGAYVHGVGFRPAITALRVATGPFIIWPLLLFGYGLLLQAQLS